MGYLRGGPLWFPASRMLGLPLVILSGPPLEPALANLTAPPRLQVPCPSRVPLPLRLPLPLQCGSAHTAFPAALWAGRAGPPRRCAEQPPGPETAVTARAVCTGALGLLRLPIRVLLCGWQLCGFERLCQLSPISWGEGTCWETDEAAELRRWQNRPSRYQETRPWWQQEWAECRGMRPTPGEKCQSATTGTAHTGHWQKMTPICVTSTLTAWKSRWNPSKNWVSMEPTCARWGPPSLAWQSTHW